MNMPCNPDIEQLAVPARTPAQHFKEFEGVVAQYAEARRIEMELSMEIARADYPVADALRARITGAIQHKERAKDEVVAQAMVLVARGLIGRGIEAFEIEAAERF